MNFPKDIILTNSVRPDAFDALDSFKIHHFPMIKITSKDIKPFNLSDYDYFIFTSQNSVEIFFDYPFVRVQYEKQIKAILSVVSSIIGINFIKLLFLGMKGLNVS